MAEFSLEPGENVIASVRKHPLIFVGNLIPYALLAWIPTLLPGVLEFLVSQGGSLAAIAQAFAEHDAWVRFVVGVFWLFIWMGAFSIFTDFYLDHLIITDHRLVRIEQRGFWDREISSLHLNRVQDVMTDVNGILPSILGYGILSVETAGDDRDRFKMRGLRDVGHLRDLIMKEVTQRQEKLSRISSSGTN